MKKISEHITEYIEEQLLGQEDMLFPGEVV
jgi:hypothetical protein